MRSPPSPPWPHHFPFLEGGGNASPATKQNSQPPGLSHHTRLTAKARASESQWQMVKSLKAPCPGTGQPHAALGDWPQGTVRVTRPSRSAVGNGTAPRNPTVSDPLQVRQAGEQTAFALELGLVGGALSPGGRSPGAYLLSVPHPGFQGSLGRGPENPREWPLK